MSADSLEPEMLSAASLHYVLTCYSTMQNQKCNFIQFEAMEDALNAGARRRALTVIATPVPVKRPLHKSPLGAASQSGSTVTPDPKRHMSESGSDVKTASSSASSAKPDQKPVPPVQLFSGDADAEVPDTLVLDETPMLTSPEKGRGYKMILLI